MTKVEEQLFIEALYDEYSLNIKAMAKYILKSERSAEKALLRTFFNIVKYKKLFYGEDSADVRRLVVVFARGACFDILRRERGISYSEEFKVPEKSSVSVRSKNGDLLSVILGKDKFEWFKETFSSYGSPFKEICVLKFYYKMKTSVVSDVLGLKASEVNSVLGSRLLKLQKQTESYINGNVEPAEMGVVVSLASRQCADDDCEKLYGYAISKTVLSPKIKQRIMNVFYFQRNKTVIWAILLALILLCTAGIFML